MDDIIYSQAVRRAREQYAETTHSPENSCLDDEFWCPEDKVCKKNKDRINEVSADEISGQRWSEEGRGFDANADLYQEVSDIKDLLEAFYSRSFSSGTHDKIAKAIHITKKTLEEIVDIDTNFDVHGRDSGPV